MYTPVHISYYKNQCSFRLKEVNVNVSIDFKGLGNLFHEEITRLKNECFKYSCYLNMKIVYIEISSPVAVINNSCTVLAIIQINDAGLIHVDSC